jgi:hypothetical protein
VKHLSAITAMGTTFPAYINFSHNPENGDVRIAGRQAAQPDGREGAPFELTMPAVCIELMFEEGLRNLRTSTG